MLGPPGAPGAIQHSILLNRLVSWTSSGISWEADPRHVSLLVEDLGVTGTKVDIPMTVSPAGG